MMELAVGGGGRAVESWQDRRIGKEVAQQREATVEQKRAEPMEPVFIEPPAHPLKCRYPVRLCNARSAKNRCPCFPEAVVGGKLPPLSLTGPGTAADRHADRRNSAVHVPPD